jgi:large subunit ribosomal protein L15
MNLGTLRPPEGSRKKRKRVGRGNGSGHGGTSCRGHKGQNARSGGGVRPGFEGGQMPLSRRLPKRGFRNLFKKIIVAINIDQLKQFPEGSVIDDEALFLANIIKSKGDGIKLLGRGSIDYPVSVKIDMISRSAKEKIEAAGGSVIEVA